MKLDSKPFENSDLLIQLSEKLPRKPPSQKTQSQQNTSIVRVIFWSPEAGLTLEKYLQPDSSSGQLLWCS